jgi:hypothetical protein
MLVRIHRSLASYAVLAATAGGVLYLWLGLAEQMLRDWTLHNAIAGAAIGLLVLIVAPRRPRNRAVWTLVATAVFSSTNALALGLAQWQLARHGLPSDIAVLVPAQLPFVLAATLQVTAWIWIPAMFVLLTLGLLLFPDGTLPSPRWRWVSRSSTGAIALASALFLWGARPSSPVVVYGGDVAFDQLPVSMRAALAVGMPALLVAVGASLAAVIRRYRVSAGLERQQFRWIAWGAATLALAVLTIVPAFTVPSVGLDLMRAATAIALPIFIATYVIAVARYRLYEIDRVISRTVSYGLLTAVLVGVYALGVLGLGGLVRSVTGQGGGDLIVAASTLAVAALFGPARRGIQAAVDRRFNRRRYDAQQAIDEFTQGLRNEIDLDALGGYLVHAADDALQPSKIGLWLRSQASS